MLLRDQLSGLYRYSNLVSRNKDDDDEPTTRNKSLIDNALNLPPTFQ